jgi:IS1 family transposase
MVGLDALPTYKRVVAWFLGPVEDTRHYLQRLHRLNRGLDTDKWRVYEHREEPNGV